MAFRLNFAPHLGFPTTDRPLFDAIVGSTDPIEHMRFAAAQGFAAVQDPFAAMRAASEQAMIGAASAELGLLLGCFVYAPLAHARTPAWTANTPAERTALSQSLDEALAVAERINSGHIAVITGQAAGRSTGDQRRAMADNLHLAGEVAAARGLKLCIEAVNARRLPNMLLNHIADALDVVRSAAHPAVRLLFDFAHVQAMEGDILYHLDRAWEYVEIVQIADNPGRVEPGAGELNFERLLNALVERGFTGLCELEHQWSRPGKEVQQNYLRWLERWRA